MIAEKPRLHQKTVETDLLRERSGKTANLGATTHSASSTQVPYLLSVLDQSPFVRIRIRLFSRVRIRIGKKNPVRMREIRIRIHE